MSARKPSDAILALVVLAVVAFLLVHVVKVVGGLPIGEVGPYTWPFVTLVAMFACGLGLLLTAIWGPIEHERAQPTPPRKGAGSETDAATITPPFVEKYGPFLLMILTTAFVWSLPVVGFAVAIVVWFPIATIMLGHVRFSVLLLSSVIFYLFTYGVFIAWLGLSVPRGRGVFSQISRALGI